MIDLTLVFPNKRFLTNNFSFTEGKNNIEKEYSDGTPFTRRKTTSAPLNVKCSMFLSAHELNVFRNFYKNTLNQGIKSFYFFSPFEISIGLKTKMRFKGDIVYTPISGTYWNANMTLGVSENDTI